MVPLGRLKLCLTSQYGLLDDIISLYVPQVEITPKMSANSPSLHLGQPFEDLKKDLVIFRTTYCLSYFDLSVPFWPGWRVIILQLGCYLFSFVSQSAAPASKVFKNWRFYCIKFRLRSAQEQISKLSHGAKSGANLGLQQTINLGLDAIAFSVRGTFTNREGGVSSNNHSEEFLLKNKGQSSASSWRSGFGPLKIEEQK